MMRYYVVTANGSFGPADTDQLIEWARDGRIAPHSLLEEEGTGNRLTASTLAGLPFAPVLVQAPSLPPQVGSGLQPMPPQVVSNYRRPDWEPPLFLPDPTNGKRELQY